MRPRKSARRLAIASLPLALVGCGDQQWWLLRPRGPVAGASLHSIIIDVLAMMVIIGPTTLLLLWCIWRYRGGRGRYTPHWENSLPIEILSWGFPLAIVAFLGYYSYLGTFQVNPFAPGVMAHGLNPDNERDPVEVDVITTDWQWLFVYPDQRIAAANELVIPARTPVRFRMSSSTVENDILIPQLMGEIDLMPGMLTRQGLIADRIGTYQGLAANFNGPGFSWMQFETKVVAPADFAAWVAQARQAPDHLDHAGFERFAAPTINQRGHEQVFSDADPDLLSAVMAETVAGKVYPTPPEFVEKKTAEQHGRRQPTSPPSRS